MIFSNKNDVCCQIDIRIDGEPIQAVEKQNFWVLLLTKTLPGKIIYCVYLVK